MTRNDPLLEPFRLKNLTLRNRILSTAHSVRYIENGIPGERYTRYHEERARGGVGLIISGASASVAPDSPVLWGQIDLSRDEVIPHLRELTRSVKRHGAAIFCQMTHQGRRTYAYAGNWLPMLSPSSVAEPHHRGIPKAM